MKVVLVAVPLINTRIPPLSIAMLAGQLKRDGHEVKSFDFNIESYWAVSDELKTYWTYYKGFQWLDNTHFETYIYPNIIGQFVDGWCKKILDEKPDIVGISVTASPSGTRLAERLKQINPDIKIVIGGPACSKIYNDERYLPSRLFDAVVHNEGELTISELIKVYAEKKRILPVPGASTYFNGFVADGGLRPPLMDLDVLPYPDFDDLKLDRYIDADAPETSRLELPFFSSRGCPARCNFCMDYKMWDTYYRQKSPKRIVAEMEYLNERYGAKNFMFIELIFNGHNKKMHELAEELASKNHDYRFWGHGRIDPRLDLATLKLLEKAGFTHFIFGLESASTRVLKLMRKGYSAEAADRVLRDLRKTEIRCSVNIITGFPGENWWDYFITILFVLKHREVISGPPGVCECNATAGSDIFLYPEKFNIKLSEHEPYRNWSTLDGKNTLKVRLLRKEIMVWIFKHVKFNWSHPHQKPPSFLKRTFRNLKNMLAKKGMNKIAASTPHT